MTQLHRRLAALLGLIALGAFVSGAGLDAPSVVPASLVLLAAVFVQPGERARRVMEPLWRGLALLLAVRAALYVIDGTGDLVLPMVDLLLLLLCAESLRDRDGSADARHFALTFALLIAAAAYRPGPAFGLLFVAYVVCATLVLVVGHVNRESRAHGRPAPAPPARFLVRVALLSVGVLMIAGVVFLFFPRVSQGFAMRVTPPIRSAAIGFSDRVGIGEHGARLEPNPEPVLRVEFPRSAPAGVEGLYWKGRSYDTFDGVAWSRSGLPTPFTPRSAILGDTLEQVIYARPLGVRVIFGVHPVLEVIPETRIRPFRSGNGDYVYVGEVDPAYRVYSGTTLPGPERLRGVSARVGPDANRALAHLMQVPQLTERTLALADSFAAAHADTYDRARAMERWFRDTFRYTLELPATRAQTGLDYFLFERRAGHCEYFSTAMVVLLRAGGVPARNVNGFLGGEWNAFGGFLTVTQNNAHSWVEVWFPGAGWVPFDPTPGGGAAGNVPAATSRLTSLRHLFAGLEHRWGKWVLDYDFDTQTTLIERAADPIGRRTQSQDGTRQPLLWLVAGVILVTLLFRFRMRLPSITRRRSAGTSEYLRLRRAYERAGFTADAALPPLAFADTVRDAPGGSDAARAVALYVSIRFGGREATPDVLQQLKTHVAAVRRELAAARKHP